MKITSQNAINAGHIVDTAGATQSETRKPRLNIVANRAARWNRRANH